jgi:hypothetical protein
MSNTKTPAKVEIRRPLEVGKPPAPTIPHPPLPVGKPVRKN